MIITEGIPEGWMIQCDWRYGGADVNACYVAYRWTSRTTKKLFRKPVTRTGWFEAGYESRWQEYTVAWIVRTDAEMKRHVQKLEHTA